MIGEKVSAIDVNGVSLGKKSGVSENVNASGRYDVICTGPDGKVKWKDHIDNVVTTEGKNEALDQFLAGSAFTAAWYMALQNGGAPLVSSTYAVPICTEVEDYTEGSRPTVAFSAASSGSKVTSSDISFSINATVTVDGVMLMDFATKGDVAQGGAVLYSAGDFSGGSKAVANGDTLNVSYTASL